jgi:hypothetical protein
MDPLTAVLWRELQLESLPIRIVTQEEFAAMTKDSMDDETSAIKKTNMKTPPVELYTIPDAITVVPFGSGFNVRCDLCTPRRSKADFVNRSASEKVVTKNAQAREFPFSPSVFDHDELTSLLRCIDKRCG